MSWTARSLAFSTLLLAVAACSSSQPRGEPAARPGIDVTSPAFADGGRLPTEYTCDGEGHSPALAWRGVPSRAKTISVTVDDPDAPGGTFTHWTVDGLDAQTTTLGRDAHPAQASTWKPACPPAGRTHHYRFTVSARDAEGRVVALGRLTATYSR